MYSDKSYLKIRKKYIRMNPCEHARHVLYRGFSAIIRNFNCFNSESVLFVCVTYSVWLLGKTLVFRLKLCPRLVEPPEHFLVIDRAYL